MKIQEILEAYDQYDLHDLQNPSVEEIAAAKKAKDIAKLIKTECSEMLAAYQSTDIVLYRGMHSEHDAVITTIRPDRQPVQMDPKMHNALHQGFLAAGLTATRSNSIFCTAQVRLAMSWGDSVYIVFVKNGWSGTVFTKSDKSDYTYYTMERIAKQFLYGTSPKDRTIEKMVKRINELGPVEFKTAPELIEVLQGYYADVIITGGSYIALKHESPLCEKVLKHLKIRL